MSHDARSAARTSVRGRSTIPTPAANIGGPAAQPSTALATAAIAGDGETRLTLQRFAKALAHELNNPLMGISSLAEVIGCDSALDADTRHMIEMIRGEALRVGRVLRDLLCIAGPDSSPATVDSEIRDLLLVESAASPEQARPARRDDSRRPRAGRPALRLVTD